MILQGTITALITPFKNNMLDAQGLQENIERQIEAQVDGILVLGTTGETPTLSHSEKKEIVSLAIKTAAGRVPVWVGTGSYSTEETIRNTAEAQQAGAQVALIVSPYYNKPTQTGLIRHFEAVARSSDIPIVVYNIASRCGVNIETATLSKIAEIPNVVGVKEASGSITQAGDVMHAICSVRPDFSVFSGDDVLTLPMMAQGARGVISVVSNLIPDKIVELVRACQKEDFAAARALHYKLLPIYKAAFLETNPIPIKKMMELCQRPAGGCRLPLSELSQGNESAIRKLLESWRLI